MNELSIIPYRTTVNEWREQSLTLIRERLEKALPSLEKKFLEEIEELSTLGVWIKSRRFRNKISEEYTRWCDKQATDILTAINAEFHSRFPDYQQSGDEMSSLDQLDVGTDAGATMQLGTATATGIAAVTGIPAVITLSTTTVTTGGILGFFGVTTTVLVPSTLFIGFGALAVVGIGAIFGMSSATTKARKRLRLKLERQLKKIFSTTSLDHRLHRC